MLLYLLFSLIGITVAITIHEFSHAFIADKLGDPTARVMGRISLNPIRHYDRIGTTMLVVTSILSLFQFPIMVFGWAKPVPFDPYNLKNPRRDAALISLAGPLSNLLLAGFLSIFLHIQTYNFGVDVIQQIFKFIIVYCILLALFNLIPVHPLDGGKILTGILPRDMAIEAEHILHRYGTLILLFLIIPINGVSPISALINPARLFLENLLIP